MKGTSESFCILPWVHLYKNMDNSIKLCCIDKGKAIGTLEDKDIDSVRNSKEFSDIRKSFIEGEKLDRCKECWAHEKAGYTSYRQSSNHHYKDLIKNTEEFLPEKPLEIKYLDYRPSNICNLACKICSPRYSSKLIDPWVEAKQLSVEEGLQLTKLNSKRVSLKVLDNNLTDVDYLYFAGGEPMIADDHWKLLDLLSKKNPESIKIKYNTNLTHLEFKNKSVEEYWPKFKKVDVGASLDGFGKQFDHMRTGAKWENIVTNLDLLKDLINKVDKQILEKHGYPKKDRGIEIYCDSTIGWLNLKSVFQLHRFLVEKEYIKLNDPFLTKLGVKPLNYPYGASLDNTPVELREELINDVEEYKIWLRNTYPYDSSVWEGNVNSLINKITNSKYDEASLLEWLKLTKILDKKYKLNTPEAFQFKSTEWNTKFYELYNR